jgi:tetratricopeptide (TPR) repeat protein
MSERQRHVSPSGSRDHADDADRESRVEQLLLAGLDQYFAGRYEQAIDIWTRVAFLERRNGRAKAYIDRARGLVAERQREADALVHEGVAAYHAGDLAMARALLTRAVDRGAQSDTALLYLGRLQRVELLPGPAAAGGAAFELPVARSGAGVWSWSVTVAASLVLALGILVGARPVASFLAELPIAMPSTAPVALDPLPVARPSDRALDQARVLRAQGRRRDALRALGTIEVADPLRAAADGLRAEIQREILAGLNEAPPITTPEVSR